VPPRPCAHGGLYTDYETWARKQYGGRSSRKSTENHHHQRGPVLGGQITGRYALRLKNFFFKKKLFEAPFFCSMNN